MQNVWQRRQVLGAAGVAVVAGVASPAIANVGKANCRSLSLNNLHTGERASFDYWVDGSYVPESLTEINHFLRDYYNNQVHVMDPKLLDLVNLLHRTVGSSAEVQVISGYRSPTTNAAMHAMDHGVAAHSLHMKGMAMDIRVSDVALHRLHSAAVAMRVGGVGYYPSADFIHVDTGRVRYWGG